MSDTMVRITPGMCEKLALWHGGQSSAMYSLLSTGRGDLQTIQKAIDEINDIVYTYLHKISDPDKEELNLLTKSLESLLL